MNEHVDPVCGLTSGVNVFSHVNQPPHQWHSRHVERSRTMHPVSVPHGLRPLQVHRDPRRGPLVGFPHHQDLRGAGARLPLRPRRLEKTRLTEEEKEVGQLEEDLIAEGGIR